MTIAVADAEQLWQRRFRYLPFALLALATGVALPSAGATGSDSPAARLVAQLVLMPVTAAWMWWWTVAGPDRRRDLRSQRIHYVGRTVLAGALTLLNPLFCIFTWVGFMEADRLFRARAQWVALGATSLLMAIGQAGGVPFESSWQVPLFVALVLLNLGLAGTMARFSVHQTETGRRQAGLIAELERVNVDLQAALTENAALHEQVVAQARAAGVQEERQRLAREIHDTVAQSLAGIVAQLQATRDDTAPAAVRRRLDRAADLAREALVEARRSMMDLVPSPLADGTLADAITALVEEWAAHHPVQAGTVVTGEVRPLHPEVEATLLRVVQEALSNVAKHAGATRIGVTLSYLDDEVALDVRDDGAGFDLAGAARPTSFGLRGMRQRAERLAGTLDLETEPGAGTALSVRLPAVERGAA